MPECVFDGVVRQRVNTKLLELARIPRRFADGVTRSIRRMERLAQQCGLLWRWKQFESHSQTDLR